MRPLPVHYRGRFRPAQDARRRCLVADPLLAWAMASQDLKTYRGKRNFARTTEPEGAVVGPGSARFVVHKHHATADHYDLRLELDGVLKSWAVPKGPSLDPADKRLAVQTEDHPLEYADFEGLIPEGEYGGGPMIVWDAGVWAPMGDAARDIDAGAFKFRLAGDKLGGGWMLTRLKPKPGETRRNWLLFKERDPAARPGSDILAERPESVKTGRAIEDLAPRPPPVAKAPARLRPGALPGARRAELPERIAPQLASAAAAPDGDGWLHEIKLDGYRTLARIEGGAARLITRAGLDWTHRYGDLPAALAALPCRTALVDGEIVALDAAGVSRFSELQDALANGAENRLVFFAFDLLHLDGWDLTAAPLVRRKALLARILAGATPRSAVHYSDHVEGGGPDFYAGASEMGLEGIVSKRADAPYRPGRSKTWTKTKALRTGDFVIAGYTTSAAAEGLAALALAEWEGDELAYRGKVGTGFDAQTLADLARRLEPLRDDAHPLPGAPRGIAWVRPVLTAQVQYANRTADGALRHAVFRGLREATMTASAAPPRKRLITEADLAAVWVTNPNRRFFGRSGPTKLDIALYYASVGDVMLPHILDRPVSLIRCPSGNARDCFYQRHAFAGMPDTVARVATETSDGEPKSYIAVTDAKGYLALAQFGVIEFHPWGAHVAKLETPDRIVFDLDPGEGVAWREIVEGAVHVRDHLRGLGLVPFAKTSGGSGIHVVVPITPARDWKAVHAWTGAVAERIAKSAPRTFTAKMGKDNRKGLIFVDYHRNVRGATAAGPYSLRSRNNLPVSMPLDWPDLESVDAPADLNYSSVPKLIAGAGDAWAEIDASARDLPDLDG